MSSQTAPPTGFSTVVMDPTGCSGQIPALILHASLSLSSFFLSPLPHPLFPSHPPSLSNQQVLSVLSLRLYTKSDIISSSPPAQVTNVSLMHLPLLPVWSPCPFSWFPLGYLSHGDQTDMKGHVTSSLKFLFPIILKIRSNSAVAHVAWCELRPVYVSDLIIGHWVNFAPAAPVLKTCQPCSCLRTFALALTSA